MSRILLVDSINFSNHFCQPQVGTLIVRNILCREFETELISFNTMIANNELILGTTLEDNIERLSEVLIAKQPDVVSFYTICDTFYVSLRLAESIKKKNFNIKIVMGGPHASIVSDEILQKFGFIDAISVGEGEKTVLALMHALVNNTSLMHVKGAVFRNQGSIIHNKQEVLLTGEEICEFTPYDFSPYNVEGNLACVLEGGRGCPYSCTFCSTSSFWGRKFRLKPIDRLIGEIKELIRRHGFVFFSIQHDLFTADRKKLIDFCNACRDEALNFKWSCSSRIDVLDRELIELMYNANCKEIFLGIETGSQRMQNLLNKKLDIKNIIEKLKMLQRVNINLKLSFIYGFPEETLKDFYQTIHLIEQCFKMKIYNVSLHVFMPMPGTVETKKVYDKLYFDENEVDNSIFNKTLFADNDLEFIRNNKDIFMHLYTFKSEVRSKYRNFNMWIECLTNVFTIFEGSIQSLLNSTTLIDLYNKYEDKIEDTRRMIENISCYVVKGEKQKCYLKLLNDILSEEYCETSSRVFKYIVTFEKLLMKERLENRNEEVIYKFDIDILKLWKKSIISSTDVYVGICNIGSNIIHIRKIKFSEGGEELDEKKIVDIKIPEENVETNDDLQIDLEEDFNIINKEGSNSFTSEILIDKFQ